jgi:hypothetical protein
VEMVDGWTQVAFSEVVGVRWGGPGRGAQHGNGRWAGPGRGAREGKCEMGGRRWSFPRGKWEMGGTEDGFPAANSPPWLASGANRKWSEQPRSSRANEGRIGT